MYVEALVPIVVLIVVLPRPAVAFPGVRVVLDLTLVPRIGACHSRAELLALAVSVTPTDVFAIAAQLVEGVLKVKVSDEGVAIFGSTSFTGSAARRLELRRIRPIKK